ncbi:MAG TPA: ORF6N domain-containing protein [Chitinophagaceae bacterium]|nr:ORF6N domain-containing protein [Chitinophagaceae bacterium]
MASNKVVKVFTDSEIVERIFIIRGQKVMMDKDLSEMYGVEVKVLNQSVKRNLSRFPVDFMFQLTQYEWENLKSQIVTSSWGGVRKLPFAFTELGVAMLSSVLRSERAIQVNIQIIRVYTKMKQILLDNKDLWMKIEKIEQSLVKKDEEVKAIFKVLKKLLSQDDQPRNVVGFKIPKKRS